MSRRTTSLLVYAALLGVFFVVLVWAMDTFITSRFPGANDFYLRWRGSKAYWVEGLNPYSPQVSRIVEIGLYGAPARPDQYPGDFVYPFYTAILVLPLALLPYDLASAIWIVLTALFVAAAYVLTVDRFKWRAPRWFQVFGIVWALT